MPAWRLFLLACLAITALAAPEPLRVVVISRYPQVLREAAGPFEARYGPKLLDIRIVEERVRCADLEGARIVFVHGNFWTPEMMNCRATVQRLAARGTLFSSMIPAVLESSWRIRASGEIAPAASYLRFGGKENLLSFFGFLYKAAKGVKALEVPDPKPQAETGIYHPRAGVPFFSLGEYLDWYLKSGLVPKDAPLVGITFFQMNFLYGDLAHLDALISALEERGIGAVPVYGWPLRAAAPLLSKDGAPAVDLLLCMNLLMPNPDNTAFLAETGLHAINLITTTESLATWTASRQGLPPARLPIQVGTPERTGAAEPILIATTEQDAGGKSKRLVPVPDRITMAAGRAARWIALRRKPNQEKRIGLIYFNNPPGKGTLGASYLNLVPSLVHILKHLRAEGYRVDSQLPDEEQLKRLILLSGRNVEAYAPGELDALMADGHATLLPVARYEQWYRELPAEFRAATERAWGKPSESKLMTVRGDGKAYFVIPGIRLGNVFLGPQPMRAGVESAAGKMHDRNAPVPHSYVAAYLWYRRQFQADALVHMGRHGTLEWLPGKDVAQTGFDSGEVLMGDLPNAYYYVVDGGGEFLQSKRRSSAVMISHLTPLMAGAGIPPDYRKLSEALDNHARVAALNEDLARQYEAEALAEVKRLELEEQIGREALASSEALERIEEHLHDLTTQSIPLGLHTIGEAPKPETLREALMQFLRTSFTEQEAAGAGRQAGDWADALLAGQEAAGLPAKTAEEARRWLLNIKESPSRELRSLTDVLTGRFLPTGVSGDPLRTPDALPTGRNMHDQDPRTFPTRSAWEVGKRMADLLIEQYRGRNGRAPEKISLVLWYGESTRHQGIAESQAMHLLGVEPVWNGRGQVDDVRLVPAEKLGRPRVDVVLTMSGLYRDGMPEKLRLLDKAVQLAAGAADDNPVRRNVQAVARKLESEGVDARTARKAASARLFGPEPGTFGVGMAGMMAASRDAGDSSAAARVYLGNMNHAYTEGLWGQRVQGNLAAQLANNQVVVHSRSTNLYGVLDNDETYQFAGGLNAATTYSSGQAPSFVVSNVRQAGQERFEEMKQFLARELNSRAWNPKWINGMKSSGYSGAQEIAKNMEHLYGLRAAAPEQVDPGVWQRAFDTYVADKENLGLEKFFAQQNPHAQQMLVARLLEVDRQGVYRFSNNDRGALVRSYIDSVNRHGVSCYVNACDNQKLQSYVRDGASQLQAVSQASLEEWEKRMRQALEAPTGTPDAKSAAERKPDALPALEQLYSSLRQFDAAKLQARWDRYEPGWEWLLWFTSAALGALHALLRRLFPPPASPTLRPQAD